MTTHIPVDDDPALAAVVERAEKNGGVVLVKKGVVVARIVPSPPPHDPEQAKAAMENILRRNLSLGGLKFKDLTHGGHKD